MPHTPEPWYLHQDEDPERADFRTRYWISASPEPGSPPVLAEVFLGLDPAEQRANAELLVRAPRLLAALRDLHAAVLGIKPHRTTATVMDAADELLTELKTARVL